MRSNASKKGAPRGVDRGGRSASRKAPAVMVPDAMRADTGRGPSAQTAGYPQLNWTGEPAVMPSENTIYVAIELSFSSWLVAARLPGAQKVRLHRIEGGNTAALLALIGDLRSSASRKLDRTADLACCFEAGRDGFWLQRLLSAHGIPAYVL